MTIKEKFRTLIPYFLLACLVILVYRLSGEVSVLFDFLRWGWGVITPFFWGFLLAYILNIPRGSINKLLEKSKNKFILKRTKMLSIVGTMLLMALLLFIVLSLVIPIIVTSVTDFIDHIPQYWETIVYFIDYINSFGLFNISADEIFNWLGNIFSGFSIDNLSAPLNAIVGAATSVFNGAIAFITSIYILVEKDRCKKYINKLMKIFFPDEVRIAITEVASRLNINVRTYIRTQTIDGIILGVMATIVLMFIAPDYAIVLGIMLGVLNYIPYFGSLFGTIAAVVVVILTQGFTMGAISAGLLLVVQQIDANIVQPKLMSGSFSLSPLLVIISITVGGAIGGILGMIVVIPIVAVLKDILDDVVEYYRRKKIS